MGVAEVKVSFQSVTALPADAVVNVFHFADASNPIGLVTRIGQFYTDVQPTAGFSIGQWLSPELSRAALAASVDVYDLAQPEPRVPVGAGGFTLPAPLSTVGLPAEVALCVSWLAAAESGVPAARRRGRNYLGPWGQDTLSQTEPSRPIADLMETIVEAAEDLITDAALVVYSRASTPAVGREVVGGYVDNAWDTMRSRGPETTSRLTFAAP